MLTLVNGSGSDVEAVVCCCVAGTACVARTDVVNWFAIELGNA